MENSLIDGEIYLDRILSCVIKEGTYYADTVNMDGKTDIDEVFPCSSQESQINLLEYFRLQSIRFNAIYFSIFISARY